MEIMRKLEDTEGRSMGKDTYEDHIEWDEKMA